MSVYDGPIVKYHGIPIPKGYVIVCLGGFNFSLIPVPR